MNATELAKVTTDPSSKAIVDFLSVLETKKVENLLTIWAEDALFELPFSHKGIPGLDHPKFRGRTRIYELFKKISVEKNITCQNIILYPMRDPEYVYIEFACHIEQLDLGIKYLNQYCGIAHVLNTEILLFREYFHALIRQNFEATGF
jgi:ketosteroid isomerase-like protein